MLEQFIGFLKHPVYITDTNRNLKYRFNIFFRLLGLSLVISIVLGMFIGMLEYSLELNLGQHAMDSLMESYSGAFVFLAAVILAPLLEEIIFRAPMIFFRRNRHFGFVFYLLSLSFGFYHITNFEISGKILLLSPILVAPQISVGLFLGFIRVRFNLFWAMLLHALYNLILIGPFLLLNFLEIPVA